MQYYEQQGDFRVLKPGAVGIVKAVKLATREADSNRLEISWYELDVRWFDMRWTQEMFIVEYNNCRKMDEDEVTMYFLSQIGKS